MDESRPPPVAVPAVKRQPVKLPGLPYIVHQQNISRQQLAKSLGVDPRRVYSLNSVKVRAQPWEIDKLTELLEVTLEQLITVPPGIEPPPVETRVRQKPASNSFEHVEVTKPAAEDPEPEPKRHRAITVLPAGVSLNLTLPDGRRFDVSSNQPASAEMLQRMSRALFLLVTS